MVVVLIMLLVGVHEAGCLWLVAKGDELLYISPLRGDDRVVHLPSINPKSM